MRLPDVTSCVWCSGTFLLYIMQLHMFIKIIIRQLLLYKALWDVIHILIYVLLHSKCFINVEIHKLAILMCDNSVWFTLAEKINCHCSHDCSIYTVFTWWASASLHMSKNCSTCLDSCSFLDPLCHALWMSYTLSVDDYVMLFSKLSCMGNSLDKSFLIVIIFLWK